MDRGMPARLRVSGRPTPKLGGVGRSDAYRGSTSETSAVSRSVRAWSSEGRDSGGGRAGTEVEREIIEGLRQSHESNRSFQQTGFARS